jgi:hypothetical protein
MGIFVFSWPKSAKRDIPLILIVTAIAVMPMMVFGYHWGHDLRIHLQSWTEAGTQFQQGIFFPRWAAAANYGFGEPRFIFYPPASWTLGGILGLLLPWRAVPAVYVWIVMILAALAMRRLAADWLSPRAALLAGLLYALNPYLLLTAYTRCAFAELLASAVFPFLLWSILRMEREPRKSLMVVAVSFAAIWLTNLPAGVIATYSLACLLIVLSIRHRSVRPLLYGSAGALAGIAVAAFSLVPAFWERKWVDIDAVLNPNHVPAVNFLFAHNSMRAMYAFNHLLSPLAVFLILASIAATIASRRLRSGAPDVWWSLAILCGASALLMFRVSTPLWRILPELRFAQFPWRWLFPLSAAAAVITAYAVSESRRKRIVLPALALTLFLVDAGITYTKRWYPHLPDEIAHNIRTGQGYIGLEEYTPLTSRGEFLPANAPLVESVELSSSEPGGARPPIQIEVWSAEKKVINADLRQATAVNLKLLAYPAWQASVNGKSVPLRANARTGQIMISLPAGTSHTEVIFARTADRTAGMAISMVSGAALITVWQFFASNRKRTKDSSELEPAHAQAA